MTSGMNPGYDFYFHATMHRLVPAGVRLTTMNEFEQKPGRPDALRFAAPLIIIAATALALGHTLRQPTQMGANDISRWCTVWSLLERGTYVIDECPWQADTQDKVFRAPKGAIAPAGGQEPVRHYYSSKPALLPTLIAGILYPARLATGVPLDRVVLQKRAPRWTQKPDPGSPYGVKGVSRDAQGARALARLHLLLQADRGAAQCHSVWNTPGALRSGARPPRGQRVGLAFLSGRRGVRDLSLAVYADPEQSHGRGLQCFLRALPALLDLGSRRSLGLAIRGRGVLRGVRRGERAAGPRVPGLVVRPAPRFFSSADDPLFPAGSA